MVFPSDGSVSSDSIDISIQQIKWLMNICSISIITVITTLLILNVTAEIELTNSFQ